MQLIGCFGNHKLRALLLCKHGCKDGSSDVVPHADDDAVKIAHADALECALIRSVCNHCMCDVICNGGNARFIAVNGQDLVAECTERLGYAFPKAANPDYGK